MGTNHVSLSSNNIDFTHELNIRSFVHLGICELADIAVDFFRRTAICSDHAEIAETFRKLNRESVHDYMVDSHVLGLRDVDLQADGACRHDKACKAEAPGGKV